MRQKCCVSQTGQAVVEMTLGFLLFLMIFFAIVEFAHLLYTKVTLQHAFRESGRYMVTGRTEKDPLDNDLPRPEVIRNVLCANLIATGLRCPDVGQFTFTCFDDKGLEVACAEPAGGPEQTVMVSATFAKPAHTPLFTNFFPQRGVQFQLSTTWKNEPFSSN